MYDIKEYTMKKAKEYGVIVKPSTNSKKKIDVFKDNKKIASIGAINYFDYPTYLQETNKQYADERRRLYYIRNKKNINNIGSNAFWGAVLLW